MKLHEYDLRVDIWQLGFFLYTFLGDSSGLKELEADEEKAYTVITTGQVNFETKIWTQRSREVIDLI